MAHDVKAPTHPAECGHCEQDARIKENMAERLDDALANGDLTEFEDIFEDRDPFEFI